MGHDENEGWDEVKFQASGFTQIRKVGAVRAFLPRIQ
jgi:hypothetical protein